LEIPIPDLREDHHGEGQELGIDAKALDLAFRRSGKSTEPEAEVLDLLRGGFLPPDPIPLETECGEGRGLEAQDFRHLVVNRFGALMIPDSPSAVAIEDLRRGPEAQAKRTA